MKWPFRALQKSGCFTCTDNRKSLILIVGDNGIKIAYREAASDAQALRRYTKQKSHAKHVPAHREQRSHEISPDRNKRSPKLERQRTFLREASDWPLRQRNHRCFERGGFLLLPPLVLEVTFTRETGPCQRWRQ